MALKFCFHSTCFWKTIVPNRFKWDRFIIKVLNNKIDHLIRKLKSIHAVKYLIVAGFNVFSIAVYEGPFRPLHTSFQWFRNKNISWNYISENFRSNPKLNCANLSLDRQNRGHLRYLVSGTRGDWHLQRSRPSRTRGYTSNFFILW